MTLPSDAQGRFRVPLLTAGSYLTSVAGTGSAAVEFAPENAGVLVFDHKLRILIIQLLDGKGQPLQAAVQVETSVGRRTSDATGRIRFDPAPITPLFLWRQTDRGAAAKLGPFAPKGEGTTEVRVKLPE
ncbi:MAG: hypothetical protein KDC87_04285 [Planctomycetes bacterium]|nr:hypothetical protein [Planctomycetota bacterium]